MQQHLLGCSSQETVPTFQKMFTLCWLGCSIEMEIPSLGRLTNSGRVVGCFLPMQSAKFLFEPAAITTHQPTRASCDHSNLTNLPRPFSHALIYYSGPIGRMWSTRQRCLLTRPFIPLLLCWIVRKAAESLPAKSRAYLSNLFSCQTVAETL